MEDARRRVAILLAAGSSQRFGAADKRRARFRGRRLIDRALATARLAPAGRVILVVDCNFRFMPPRGVTLVRAERSALGLAESLKAGLAALSDHEREIFIFLADMPLVPHGLARRLIRAFDSEVDAARGAHGGRAGHPVLLRRPAPETVARLSGDAGLRRLLGSRVALVEAGRGVLIDIDRCGLLDRLG